MDNRVEGCEFRSQSVLVCVIVLECVLDSGSSVVKMEDNRLEGCEFRFQSVCV